MGGKNKQSQRTKNNARPSSSGRSAELLGSVQAGFVGFSSIAMDTKPMPLSFPLSLDSPENDLSTEFSLVIKKLNKKDPITKTKALQEMSELVKERSLEEVTSVLPYWSRLYRILTNDTEHKVREGTQSTHNIFVNKCGRSIAPYLKQIIPTWLTAQYDNFAPAASSAQASLQSAFPESKLPEVVSFCKAEVMAHISANLIGDHQAALINNKEMPAEIVEMRYQRLTMGTLQGFNFFIKHLPDKQSEWLWTEQLEIFDSAKFWKLASDKCSQIRSAWFGVIARQIERFPEQFGEKYGAKATKVLVNNLIEKDPVVAMQLWECFLLLTAHVKDWYSWVDKKEQLSRRILDVLENGGWGNATYLATIILPLMANFPQEMLTKEFYTQFFIAMINGLNKKAILASKSHRQSCLTAIGECLKYVSIQQIDTFAVEIVTSVLRTWLEKILESPYETQVRNNIIKFSATVMVSLVKYWLKQTKESKSSDKYNQLLRNFWQNKCSTIVHQIEKLGLDHEAITRSVEGHILLLQTLNASFDHETKKRPTIKFEVDAETEVDKPRVEDKSESDIKLQEMYKHNLNQLVYTTCSHYLHFADEKEISRPIFIPLFTLLNEFNSRDLFVAIASSFSKSIGKEGSLYDLYEGVFKRWLSGDTMRCKEVVHITFLLVPHLNSEEQRAIFKSYNQFVPPVVEVIISMCLSHPYSSYDYVRDWMKSDVVDITLTSICKRLVKSGDSQSKNLLLMSFSQDRNGDIIISEKACSGILSVLCEALKDVESPYLDMCASLSSQLVTVLLTEDKSDAYKELLLQMFKLNSTVKPNDEILSEDTWWELKTSWQDGLSTMEEEERTVFIENAIKLFQQNLSANNEEIDCKKADDIVELTTSLMSKFNGNSKAEENVNEIVTIAEALFAESSDTSTSKRIAIEVNALTYDCLTGRINFFCGDNEAVCNGIVSQAEEEKAVAVSQNVMKYFICKSLIKAKYLSAVVFGPQKRAHELGDEISEEDVDKALAWSSTILSDERIQEQYLKCLHDYAVLQSLDKAYSFWPYYTVISDNRNIIESHLKEIAVQMSSDDEVRYLSTLFSKSSEKGFYWNNARRYFQKLKSQTNHELKLESSDTSGLVAYKSTCWLDGCNYAHPNVPQLNQMASNIPTSDNILDLMNEPWQNMVRIAASIDKLTADVSRDGGNLSESQWDSIVLTMCSHIRSIDKAKLWWSAVKVVLVARPVLKLLAAVQSLISSIETTPAELRSPENESRLNEWNDVINLDVTEHIYSLILGVLNNIGDVELGINHTIFLSGLSEVVKGLNWNGLPDNLKDGQFSLNKMRITCLRAFTGESCQYQLKYLSYFVLKGVMKALIEDDMTKITKWADEINQSVEENPDADPRKVKKPKLLLDSLDMILTALGKAADTELSVVRMGEESYTLVPFTESYSVVLNYLLLVEFIMDTSIKADIDVQQQYIEFFRNGNHIDLVMSNCMRLLPSVILNRAREPTQVPVVPPHYNDMFTKEHTFTATEPPLSTHIEALACRCMMLALSGVGVVSARGWYGTLSGRLSKTIDNIVSAYITPSVVRVHYNLVQEKASTIADVVITSLWSSYEFVAEYELDGAKMELQIMMNSNHPLSIPKVQSLRTPVNHSQWISYYLSYQNGTVLEAVRLWSNALARKVVATAPCYICYCRLHPASGELPRVYCAVCKNRFHTRCIYKWFRSSTRSTCPICRSLF